MKSIKRCQRIITLFILMFIIGIIILTIRINKNASFYILHSGRYEIGKVYDRKKDILFDGTGGNYEAGYFTDVGNLIGDNEGQMENTLVAQNIEKLNNYSFLVGLVPKHGNAAIYTTLDHTANRATFNAYNDAKGCAVAYNYKTGEILVCVSLPSFDPMMGYGNISEMESGTLISKAMCCTVPGSIQKISTVIISLEIMGKDKLFSKTFNCSGHYTNQTGSVIDCHNTYGHGDQNIQKAIENSCNSFFAQLVEDDDMPIESIKSVFSHIGYSVNKAKPKYICIDGIQCEMASIELTNTADFNTQWGCIGQSTTLVSPVQMMMWQSAIANRTGKMTMPHLISYITDVYGKISHVYGSKFSKQIFSKETASIVSQMLLTNGANHYIDLIPGYKIGIKSGTAQVNNGREENSLLAGFVDDPFHPIAFCVLLENKFSTLISAEHIVNIMLNSLTTD